MRENRVRDSIIPRDNSVGLKQDACPDLIGV